MRKRLLTMTAAALLISGFTSCVYDREELPANNNVKGSLTITIKSDDFDAPITRAVDNQTEQTATIENTITTSQTVIAIFDASGNIIDVEVPTIDDGKLTLSKTQTGVDWLASASEIYVAANLPAAKVTALAALTTTKADFVTAMKLTVAEALNESSLTGAKIPMFGSGTITNSGSNDYSATINVEHMLTKITLNSLGVDFSQSDMPNASFQPEQVFLTNVPDNIGIDASGDITQATPDKWYFGEVAGGDPGDGTNGNVGVYHAVPDYATTYTAGDGYGDQFNANADLGTAALTAQTEMKAESPVWLKTATAGSQVIQQYFFYTMPNTTAADAKTQTRLVIRGAFKENASAAAEEVYYAVPLFDSGASLSSASLAANKNYKMDVIIKHKGAPDAYAPLPNDITATLAVTYSVTDFTATPSTVVIGNGAKTVTDGIENTVKVGDYFYSDGTWSSVYDNTKTLVGLVFSTNVSDADIAAGYTHGYVMALTNAGYNYNNGDPTTAQYKFKDFSPLEDGERLPGLSNIGYSADNPSNFYWNAIRTDMDGYSHTNTIGQYFVGYNTSATGEERFAAITAAGTEIEDKANQRIYPAAYAAKTYGVTVDKSKCSGWYLPSIGQLYEIFFNFGRAAWVDNQYVYGGIPTRKGRYNEYHCYTYYSASEETMAAINDYLEARLVTAANLTSGSDYQPFFAQSSERDYFYTSSSDYSDYYCHAIGILKGDELIFETNRAYYNYYYVRPVLAF